MTGASAVARKATLVTFIVTLVLLLAAACSDHRGRTRSHRSGSPARVDHGASKRHSSHEHGHGAHPHSSGSHHHHPHPHPHLDGVKGHHHPY